MNRRTIVTKNRFADLSARYTSLQINTIGAIGRFISILIILLAVRSAAKSPSEAEDRKLPATIDRYMQEWKQDEHSKYNQAMQSWLTTSPEPKHYIPRWVFTTLLAVALFVLILVAWIWTLRHLVNTRTAALQDSDNRFRRLYENASYGILICELIVDDNNQPVDFVHLRANEATAKNTGFDLSKIINQRASTMISPEELDALLRIYGGVVKTGQSATYKQHFPLYDRTLNVTCFSLKDQQFVINFIDVSEWAKAAKELEQHREHLENLVRKRTEELTRLNSEQQLILDSVRATIWHKDTQNNILRVNKAGAASVGLMAEDIEGKSTQEIFPQEAEQYYRDDLEVIESGKPKLGIIELLHTPDGRELWMLTDKIPIKSSAGLVTGIIAFAVDVTETKTAQQSLEKRSEELRTIVNAMAGRENRMAELKSIINAMRIQLEQAGIPTNVDWPPQDGHSESLQGNHNDSL